MYAFYSPFTPLPAPPPPSHGPSPSHPSCRPRAVAASPDDFLCLLHLLGRAQRTLRPQCRAESILHRAHGLPPSSSASSGAEVALRSHAILVAQLFWDLLDKPPHPGRAVRSQWDATDDPLVVEARKLEVMEVMMRHVLQGECALQWLAEVLGVSGSGMKEERMGQGLVVVDHGAMDPATQSAAMRLATLLHEVHAPRPSHAIPTSALDDIRHRPVGRGGTPNTPRRAVGVDRLAKEEEEKAVPRKDRHGERLLLRSFRTMAIVVSALLQMKTTAGRSAALDLLEVAAAASSASSATSSVAGGTAASALPTTHPMVPLCTSCAEIAAEDGDEEMVTRLLFLLYRSHGALGVASLCGLGAPFSHRPRAMAASSRVSFWGRLAWRRGKENEEEKEGAEGKPRRRIPLVQRLSSSFWTLCAFPHWLSFSTILPPSAPLPVSSSAASEAMQPHPLEGLERATTRLLKSAVHAALRPVLPTTPLWAGTAAPKEASWPLFPIPPPPPDALAKLEETTRLFVSLAAGVSWPSVAGMAVELLTAAATMQQWYAMRWRQQSRVWRERPVGRRETPKKDGPARHSPPPPYAMDSVPKPIEDLQRAMASVGTVGVEVLHLLCARLPSHTDAKREKRSHRSVGQQAILVACAELVCRCLFRVTVWPSSSSSSWCGSATLATSIPPPQDGEGWDTVVGQRQARRSAWAGRRREAEAEAAVAWPVESLPFLVPPWREMEGAAAKATQEGQWGMESGSHPIRKGPRGSSHGAPSPSAATGSSSTLTPSNAVVRLQPIAVYLHGLFDFLCRGEEEAEAMRRRPPHPSAPPPAPPSLASLQVYMRLAMAEGRLAGLPCFASVTGDGIPLAWEGTAAASMSTAHGLPTAEPVEAYGLYGRLCEAAAAAPPPLPSPSWTQWIDGLVTSSATCRKRLWQLILQQSPPWHGRPPCLPTGVGPSRGGLSMRHAMKEWEGKRLAVYTALSAVTVCREEGGIILGAAGGGLSSSSSSSPFASSPLRCMRVGGEGEISLALATLYHLGRPAEKELVEVVNRWWHLLWEGASTSCRVGERMEEEEEEEKVGGVTGIPPYVKDLSHLLLGDQGESSSSFLVGPTDAVVVMTTSALEYLLRSASASSDVSIGLTEVVRLVQHMPWDEGEERNASLLHVSPMTPAKRKVRLVLTPECGYRLGTLPSEWASLSSMVALRRAITHPHPSIAVGLMPPLDRSDHDGAGGEHDGEVLYHRFLRETAAPFCLSPAHEGTSECRHLAANAREWCAWEQRPMVLLWREPSSHTGEPNNKTPGGSPFPPAPARRDTVRRKRVLDGPVSPAWTDTAEETEEHIFGPGWRADDGMRLWSVRRAQRFIAKASIRAACHSAPLFTASSAEGGGERGWHAVVSTHKRRGTIGSGHPGGVREQKTTSHLSPSRDTFPLLRERNTEGRGSTAAVPFVPSWNTTRQCTPSGPLLKVLGVQSKRNKPA